MAPGTGVGIIVPGAIVVPLRLLSPGYSELFRELFHSGVINLITRDIFHRNRVVPGIDLDISLIVHIMLISSMTR
jgi:hypothetical protein